MAPMSGRAGRWWLLALTLWTAGLSSPPASAHDLQPGAVALREIATDTYRVRLTPAQDGTGRAVTILPTFPAPCSWRPPQLFCPGGLPNTIELPGLGDARVRVVVFARFLDGSSIQVLVPPGETTANLTVGDTEGDHTTISSLAYLPIGVEHILFGPDHLLFVLGLFLLARTRWALLGAITGFTIAHSVTLAATVLGWLSPPMAATELIIAASVFLMVTELLRREPGWTRQQPWLVATLFGLVHGFGFAGALLDLGLPNDAIVPALLWFNIGVEAGQLFVVGVAVAVRATMVHFAGPALRSNLRLAFIYAMGLVASFWTVERFFIWLGVVL